MDFAKLHCLFLSIFKAHVLLVHFSLVFGRANNQLPIMNVQVCRKKDKAAIAGVHGFNV